MLNIIWAGLICVSVLFSFASGTADRLSDSVYGGISQCVEFILSTGAFMVMWSGFMNIAQKSGLTKSVSRLLSPFVTRVFKNIKKGSREEELIASNMTANILGLSNAATPLGIEAMKELAKKSDGKKATDNMCLLAVINSASIQLVPTTLIATRSASMSKNPSDIIVPVWIVSAITLAFAIICARFCAGRER